MQRNRDLEVVRRVGRERGGRHEKGRGVGREVGLVGRVKRFRVLVDRRRRGRGWSRGWSVFAFSIHWVDGSF